MAIKEIIYTAEIIESERGWGQRLDEVREFSTKSGRNRFIKRFNAGNNKPIVPDWYMYAREGADKIKSVRKK